MGKYVNGGKVVLPEKVDYDNAVREVASLLKIGARPDRKYTIQCYNNTQRHLANITNLQNA